MFMVAFQTHSSLACTCSEFMPGQTSQKRLSDEEINAARFDRAKDVVRGKFTFLSLGPDVRRGFTVKMHVDETIKGNLSGEIELVTGFGNGDCGLFATVVNLMFYDRPIEIEIQNSPVYQPGSSGINMCGYIRQPEPLQPLPSTKPRDQ